MAKYIYHHPNWPNFYWDDNKLSPLLGKVRHQQGVFLGKMSTLGFSLKSEATLTTLTLDVIKSFEIEGEMLNYAQVRSSFARRLGIETAGLVYSARNIDGIIGMMLDATHNYDKPLTDERLFGWHSVLFPTGRNHFSHIVVGNWREGDDNPMQVVSGPMGKEIVHFQAPDSSTVPQEMERFLNWINTENNVDSVIKAAIAHLWFVIIHPFVDGNGRIGRAIADMLLARSDNSTLRFYSFSAQIMKERKRYYEVLQLTQKESLDITVWLEWFLNCMEKAILNSELILQNIISKSEFWRVNLNSNFNERQIYIINKLFDGFDGKLQTSKWAKMCKCSPDTALRDIKDLIEKGILKQEAEGGRSTNYELIQ